MLFFFTYSEYFLLVLDVTDVCERLLESIDLFFYHLETGFSTIYITSALDFTGTPTILT
jgi:hypothetical protein